jgi:hypothetical protein
MISFHSSLIFFATGEEQRSSHAVVAFFVQPSLVQHVCLFPRQDENDNLDARGESCLLLLAILLMIWPVGELAVSPAINDLLAPGTLGKQLRRFQFFTMLAD